MTIFITFIAGGCVAFWFYTVFDVLGSRNYVKSLEFLNDAMREEIRLLRTYIEMLEKEDNHHPFEDRDDADWWKKGNE